MAERQLPVALDAPVAESQSPRLTAVAAAELPDAPESAEQVRTRPELAALAVVAALAAQSPEPAVWVVAPLIWARAAALLAWAARLREQAAPTVWRSPAVQAFSRPLAAEAPDVPEPAERPAADGSASAHPQVWRYAKDQSWF